MSSYESRMDMSLNRFNPSVDNAVWQQLGDTNQSTCLHVDTSGVLAAKPAPLDLTNRSAAKMDSTHTIPSALDTMANLGKPTHVGGWDNSRPVVCH